MTALLGEKLNDGGGFLAVPYSRESKATTHTFYFFLSKDLNSQFCCQWELLIPPQKEELSKKSESFTFLNSQLQLCNWPFTTKAYRLHVNTRLMLFPGTTSMCRVITPICCPQSYPAVVPGPHSHSRDSLWGFAVQPFLIKSYFLLILHMHSLLYLFQMHYVPSVCCRLWLDMKVGRSFWDLMI